LDALAVTGIEQLADENSVLMAASQEN